MKLGIVSDTHIPSVGKELPEELLTGLAGVSFIIHAGDIVRKEVIDLLGEIAPVKAVHGNMDSQGLKDSLPEKLKMTLEGYVIGVIHGHQFRGSISNASYIFPETDIIIFGHTHCPFNKIINDRLFFNPGSPTDKRLQKHHTYGIITLGDNIEGELVKISQ